MSGPIKPSDVSGLKARQIPTAVFDAVNELIVEKWDGRSAVILQCTLVKRIRDKDASLADKLFEHHYLDFEDVYRKEGWTVSYDRPAYCETYEPSFTFTKKGE